MRIYCEPKVSIYQTGKGQRLLMGCQLQLLKKITNAKLGLRKGLIFQSDHRSHDKPHHVFVVLFVDGNHRVFDEKMRYLIKV